MTVQELTDEQIAARLAAVKAEGDIAANLAEIRSSAAEGGGFDVGHKAPAPLSIAQALNEQHAVFGEAEAKADRLVGALTRERGYRYVRPLTEAADSLIDFLRNSDGRLMLGLPEIDILTRGFGPAELVYMTGYTHSGKTQVALTMIVNNRDKRIVLFTADEPAELVLTKLVCMRTGSNAERLEERVKAGDNEAINRVRRITREDFKNLLIIDQSMQRQSMHDAVKEAEDWFEGPLDCVVMDYLELFARAEGADVEEASQHLKGWALSHPFPTICLHQGSRGNSAGGQKLTMRSMKYGGEQEAIFVLGVRRQRDDEDLDDHERLRHQDTVDISVLKNKRPPSKVGEHTFYLDPACGLIAPLSHRPEPPTGLAAVRRSQLSRGQMNFNGEEVE